MKHTQGKWEIYMMTAGFPMIIRRKKVGLTVIGKLLVDETSPHKAEQEANAKRIVHCVNNYDALVEALEEAHNLLLDLWPTAQCHDDVITEVCDRNKAALEAAKEAE